MGTEHESYDDLKQRFLFQAARLGMCAKVIGVTDGYPIYLARPRIINPALKRILVVAGFHGNEPAGCLGLIGFLEHADPSLLQRVNLSVLPCVNPWGLEQGSRYGASGLATNSMYEEAGEIVPSEQALPLYEIREGLAYLGRDLVLDLHESEYSEDRSYYLYSVGDVGWAVGAVKETMKRYFKARGDGVYCDSYPGAEPYEVRDGVIWDKADGSWDWYVVAECGVAGSLVFETPSRHAPFVFRAMAHRSVIEGVVSEAVKGLSKVERIAARVASSCRVAGGYPMGLEKMELQGAAFEAFSGVLEKAFGNYPFRRADGVTFTGTWIFGEKDGSDTWTSERDYSKVRYPTEVGLRLEVAGVLGKEIDLRYSEKDLREYLEKLFARYEVMSGEMDERMADLLFANIEVDDSAQNLVEEGGEHRLMHFDRLEAKRGSVEVSGLEVDANKFKVVIFLNWRLLVGRWVVV